MKRITTIEANADLKEKKRVAAYARVSRETDRTLHSLSTQISYYSDLIQNTPDWEFAGIYVDEGITGTKVNKRDEFKRLLKDCDEGKIDIILVKSISRFARNTVDLLEIVRNLKQKGIEVRFEKERINTLTEDGELMLTLLASFAQEEVRTMSENIKWTFKKMMEEGRSPSQGPITGYRWVDDKLEIVPEEAEIVRRIFSEYLSGKSAYGIAKALNEDGIKSINGKRYSSTTICYILRNVIYTGDLLLQRYYSADPITKELKKNRGEKDQYLVKNNHEAIVDKKTFAAAQKVLARREATWRTKEFEPSSLLTLSRKVRCPDSKNYFRRKTENAMGWKPIWKCLEKDCPKRSDCDCRNAPELAIEQACTRALGLTEYDEEKVKKRVKEVQILSYGTLQVTLKNGTSYKDYYRDHHGHINFDRKPGEMVFKNMLVCGCCEETYIATSQNYRGGHKMQWHCPNGDNTAIHENILRHRIKEASGWDEFSVKRLYEEVDHIEMDKKYHMKIHYKDGNVKPVEYYAIDAKRKK